jgi:hypothetical protein
MVATLAPLTSQCLSGEIELEFCCMADIRLTRSGKASCLVAQQDEPPVYPAMCQPCAVQNRYGGQVANSRMANSLKSKASAKYGSQGSSGSYLTTRALCHRRILLIYQGVWLRGQDLNLRPSGYEPEFDPLESIA